MQTRLFGEKYTVFVLRVHVAVLFAQLQMMFAHKDGEGSSSSA